MEADRHAEWESLTREIVSCQACPRLVEHRERVAREKKRMYRDQEYWGRPVPGFGDPDARVWIIGLAPAAHGANRTGRMFTGDRSGDWLFRALHRAGFADRPVSVSRDDGLRLRDCFISAPVRCAPPANRPTADEFAACLPFLERERRLLARVRVVVTLGRIGTDVFLRLLRRSGHHPAPVRFAHGRVHELGAGLPRLVTSYHPSRQNTQTGLLSEAMLDDVFLKARSLLDGDDGRTAGRGETRGATGEGRSAAWNGRS